MEQRDSEEIISLGRQLNDRIEKTEARLNNALAEFNSLGYSEVYLQSQFKQQRAYQSRPIQSE